MPCAAGSQVRFPAYGGMTLHVIGVPPMEATIVPVLEAASAASSIFEWTDNIGDDSPEVGLLRYSFPFSEFTARSPPPISRRTAGRRKFAKAPVRRAVTG